MRLATWNVNSLRSRLDRVLEWLEASDIDVLALQETKVADDAFPAMPFEAIGYEVAHRGFDQWNGVAVASRVGLAEVTAGFPGVPPWGEPPRAEARALGVTCAGVRVWSLYVPNGRGLDDPHLQYKLDWLAALRAAGSGWLAERPDSPVALVGDFNIAPTDEDVWDPAYFADKTHTSPAERAAFAALVEAGFADVVRPHTAEPGTFTYWDYQQLRFPKKQGMRIDFVLASPALAARVSNAWIDRQQRKPKASATGQGPSDHAPVIVELTEAA